MPGYYLLISCNDGRVRPAVEYDCGKVMTFKPHFLITLNKIKDSLLNDSVFYILFQTENKYLLFLVM